MGHDDGEVGEVGGDVVEAGDGPGVLELEPHAAGLARARSGEPRVDQQGHAQRLAFFVERVETRVVGIEGLVDRVELQPPQPQLGDRALELFDGGRAFPRVHGREPDELFRVGAHDLGHIVVGVGGLAGGGLAVDGEDDAEDVPLAVPGGHVRRVLRGRPDPEELPQAVLYAHGREARLPGHVYVHVNCAHCCSLRRVNWLRRSVR